MAPLRIIGLCISAAVLYGVAHDQVTARVCVEYFTIGHPRIIATESPTVLGLAWGVIATWWVGLIPTVGSRDSVRARAAGGGREPHRARRGAVTATAAGRSNVHVQIAVIPSGI